MFLRKSVIPTEFFQSAMEHIGRIIFKIEPSKRALFLYNILENINTKYNLMENSEEFVSLMYKILVNRIPSYLKNDFGNLARISINERSFNNIIADLEELIYYLNDISEYSWIIIIIRNLYANLKKYRSDTEAIRYVRRFIDFSIDRNRFEIAFEIYDFLENIFIYQTDLGYDNTLIELWVEACKKFVDMKEKKYLLQSIEKLNNHLNIPQDPAEIFHYFHTCNYQWKFKSMFFSLEKKDFWRMMFYRTLFEENQPDLAKKIIPFLSKNIRPLLSNLGDLYDKADPLKKQIYSFEEEKKKLIDLDFDISQIIININKIGTISYRVNSSQGKSIENSIQDEYWNDTQILEIYNDLFSYSDKDKTFNFSLTEFGKLLYIFLPEQIRNFFRSVKIKSLKEIPQIYFILDSMTIPFEMIYDNNLFLLKYACGYKIGNIPISGIETENLLIQNKDAKEVNFNPNVLIVDSINALSPKRWNESCKSKELIYSFEAGANELQYISEFFSDSQKIDKITILSGIKSTRENIIENIEISDVSLIHFVGNIFYSKWSPKNSFFYTNDNEIIKFEEIFEAIRNNPRKIKPLLFFNVQVYDMDGNKIKNTLKTFGEIVSYFNYDAITGIICKTYPIFNEETKLIVSNFYNYILNGESQGSALLRARQEIIAEATAKNIEKQMQSMSRSKFKDHHIDLKSSLALSSYILFGRPWKGLFKN
ncbi:MAG: CHAT domain-containing protein [Promethearchaeota archaeon]|nr:MAG: CHAT domain-containing protein [Candidatus Lokiarchaeota archaeon]